MRTSIIGLTVVFVLGLFASPLLADGQQAGKVYRIGYPAYEAALGPRDEAFRQALRELGWVEGENITIEYRWSAGKRDRLHAMIEELVRLPVDLMVVPSGRVVRPAKRATSTIPIVMRYAADVMETGVVASLAQPGGNITGLSEQFAAVNTKLLELLHETLPQVTRVAYLWYSSPVYLCTFKRLQAAAPELGLTIQSLKMQNREDSEELKSLLEKAVQEQAG